MPDLLARLTGALADRYRVDREIGRGGMAHVFLAHDLKLDRPVALKVLRPDLAAVLGGERFLREITLAAKLEHPHILGIHDSGEADGILYYVMPYVDGESLRARLSREKQLPLDDALQISREVADALSYAHSRGVIHRDIKPENILLEAGHAVVADFGIARAIDAAGGEKLTETGVTLGTPAYMSPEQAGGSRDLDGRSDLYSLGCVLYEMLAGQPPFTGPTIESLVRQHLAAEPPNITNVRPSVPSWVVTALSRSLAKTPADRFNPVAQFVEAIAPRLSVAEVPGAPTAPVLPARMRRWPWLVAGAAVLGSVVAALVLSGRLNLGKHSGADGLPAPRPWVIVADFDGTADPSYRRAARDLVGTVLDQSTVAATLPTEQVRRGLELAGKPETTTVTEAVARELAVRGSIGSVVTGQVDRVGASYSVLLRLVRAETGEVVATEDRTAGGDDALIPVIEEMVRAFRARLGEHRASLEASRPMPEGMTPSFAAYQKYADAERLIHDAGAGRAGERLLREAVALDPDFAAAWLLLAVLLPPLGNPDWAALEEARRRPERLTSAQRLRLEWNMANARWHHSAALLAAEQWVRERPNDWQAWNLWGITLFYLRGPDDYVEILDRAAGVDPYTTSYAAGNRTIALILAGRRAEARQTAQSMGNERRRVGLFLTIAGLEGAWAELDSLGPLWERAYLAENGRAPTTGNWRRTLHLVRGEVRAAIGEPEGTPGSKLPLLWELATGASITTSADTSWAGAFQVALSRDTAAAWAAMPRLTADSLDYRVQSGYWSAAIEAAIAAQRGDWTAVVRHTGPLVRDRPAVGLLIGPCIRWLTAHAYEQLDRLDSAVVLLGELVEPGRLEPPTAGSFPYGAAHSYLRQHLIVLLARLGRVDEARRHWETFRTTFTNPDPEYAHLTDEARAALEAADRKTTDGRRRR
jgi:serine/threonine-protein kinase